MYKNLVIIHLESLNNIVYRLHPEWFPTIRMMEREGVSFSNYFSSATSTVMVMTDLFYGTTRLLEKQTELTNVNNMKTEENSLFDVLLDKGFSVKNYLLWGNYDTEGTNRVLCHECECVNTNSMEELSCDLGKFVCDNKQFAIFVDDDTSSIDYKGENRLTKTGIELKSSGFATIDNTVRVVAETLKKQEKYEDTIFLLYGDHGDDFWTHGLHDGYSHAVAPYQHLIHTPLIIVGAKAKDTEIHNLISTIDLKDLILNLLLCEDECLEELCPNRETVFSRNLFVSQKLKKSSLNKSYSVTNGKYLLIVSNKGMELYSNCFDINSMFNLLNLFVLKKGKLKFRKQYRFTKSTHLNCFMTSLQIEEIEGNFFNLYEVLNNELKRKYLSVNKNIKEMNFAKIHYTKRYYFELCNIRYVFYLMKYPGIKIKRICRNFYKKKHGE